MQKRGDDRFRTFSEVYGTVSAAKFANCVVGPGDRILIQSPGGGGYGPAARRDPQLVLEDVEQGFISERAAREVYQVAVERDGSRYAVNEAATAGLRGE